MTPCKLLLGKTDDIQESAFWSFGDEERNALAKHHIDVVTFGSPHADIVIDPITQTFAHLQQQLQQRHFQPDLAIILAVGYGFLLEGIELAPFPVALTSLEWFLKAETLHKVSQRVDFIIGVLDSARPPIQRLTGKNPLTVSISLLGDKVDAFQPLDNTEKIYDVAYIGNCNAWVHPARTRFMESLALLPEKYRVFIGDTSVPDQPAFNFTQTNLLNNQAKICINFSQRYVRGVGNRVAHTLLSGAFLLTDHMLDENDFLKDGVHCAFYEDDEPLENKIAYYLEHEQERQTIAQQGLQHAQNGPFSFSKVLLQLVHQIQQVQQIQHNHTPKNRPFNSLPKYQQLNHLGMEALSSKNITRERGMLKALRYLEQAYELNPKDPEICNNMGIIYAAYWTFGLDFNEAQKEQLRQAALSCFGRAESLASRDVISWFNHACFCYKTADREAFNKIFIRLSEILECPDDELVTAFPHQGGLLTDFFDFLSMKKWQQLFCDHFQDGKITPPFYLGAKRYLLWKLNEMMGELLRKQNKTDAAVEHYQEACTYMPDADTTFFELGNRLIEAGNPREAIKAFQNSLNNNPLNVGAAQMLCKLLVEQGFVDEVKAVVDRYFLITLRIKYYYRAHHFFKELREQLVCIS